MFTSIVVPPAVVIINESDLAPVLEELTRRSHVIITGAVTRQEVTSCQGVREVFFFGIEVFFLYAKGKRASVRTPFAHDLPLFRVDCAPRPGMWEGSSAQRGTWSWWQLDGKAWEAGSCTHPHLLLSSRKWRARDAVVQSNHHGTSGVHPLPSSFKVTNLPHGILYFPGISTR